MEVVTLERKGELPKTVKSYPDFLHLDFGKRTQPYPGGSWSVEIHSFDGSQTTHICKTGHQLSAQNRAKD
jgi:hypothetical protein